MRRHLLRRLKWLLPTWLGVVLLVLVAVDAAPGDAASAALGVDEGHLPGIQSQERLREFRARFLLDRPILVQFLHFLGPLNLGPAGPRWLGGSGEDPWHGLLAFDLGEELQRPGVSVAGELARRLAVTVPLSSAAIALAFLLAVPLGLYSAARRGAAWERATTQVVFLIHALPSFWAGLLLVTLFGARGLGWLPSLGLQSPESDSWSWPARCWDLARHALLPVLTLALSSLAYLSRQVQVAALEALASDAVRTARAKGLSEARVLWRHVFPLGLTAALTLLSSMAPALVGGTLVVETLFDLPGMGRYAWEGLRNHDLQIVLSTTACAAAVTLLAMWLAEVGMAIVDPRLSFEEA